MTPNQIYKKVEKEIGEIEAVDYETQLDDFFALVDKELIRLRKESNVFEITDGVCIAHHCHRHCRNAANELKSDAIKVIMESNLFIKVYQNVKREFIQYGDQDEYCLMPFYHKFVPFYIDRNPKEYYYVFDKDKLTIKFQKFINYMKYYTFKDMDKKYTDYDRLGRFNRAFNQIQAFHVLCYGKPSEEMYNETTKADPTIQSAIELFNKQGPVKIVRNALGTRNQTDTGSCVLKFPDIESFDKAVATIDRVWDIQCEREFQEDQRRYKS